jgi:hypothetical protein
VRLADFEADLRQGDGNELAGKFLSVHSSSALAVNTFAPFKRDPGQLCLFEHAGLNVDGFERKCDAGVGRGPPNLDAIASNRNSIVAIESKCTEHLTAHRAEFSDAYNKEIQDWRRKTTWFDEMNRLVAQPDSYLFLDVAQLVKHAFGLGFCFQDQEATLLYLYWEPQNFADIPELVTHRKEVKQLSQNISGSKPKFLAASYRELWDAWMKQKLPVWLPAHVNELRRRYDILI